MRIALRIKIKHTRREKTKIGQIDRLIWIGLDWFRWDWTWTNEIVIVSTTIHHSHTYNFHVLKTRHLFPFTIATF